MLLLLPLVKPKVMCATNCATGTYVLSEKTTLTQLVLLDLHVPLEGSQVYPLVPALGLEPRKTSF